MVRIGFDNVHYFRDNPNVPSDLELMPALLNFFNSNGTMLTNSHTPLIAHTADDLLTTATGLYGDRHGAPIANSYRSYNTDGTTDLTSVFAYWNDPIPDINNPNPGHDTNPEPGVLAGAACHLVDADYPEQDHASAVGAVHQGRLQRGRHRHR